MATIQISNVHKSFGAVPAVVRYLFPLLQVVALTARTVQGMPKVSQAALMACL